MLRPVPSTSTPTFLLASVLVLVPVPVRAGTPVPSPSPPVNEITLGLSVLSGDRHSAEFLEYRDVPQGVTLPSFRFAGRAGGFDYDLAGRDAGQDDQRFRAAVSRGAVTLTGRLDDVPHRLGDVRTPFGDGGPGAFTLPFRLRRDVQADIDRRAGEGTLDQAFLASVADDILAGGRRLDLGFVRRTTGLALAVRPADGLALTASYDRQRREGTRASGVGFGLRNAVEVAEPVDDVTHDASLAAELERGWGVARASVGYSAYRNGVDRLAVDNPLRATDATAPGAQLGPNNSTTAGAGLAEVALTPDNDAVTAAAGGTVRLPLRTRLSADLTAARWRQSDALIPRYGTNGAIVAPAPAVVPVGSLDGSIRIGTQTVALTSAPWAGLSLRARYRRDDRDNRTPRVTLPGVARLDAVFEAVPRITVPYSYQSARREASVGYRIGSWRIEAGGRHEDIDRTFRETARTRETTWSGILAGPLPADGRLQLHYERGHRGFDAYDSRLSPGASRVNVHPVRSLGAGRRYDQSVRDADRAGATVEIAPASALALSASWELRLDRYPQTAYGFVRARTHAGSLDAAFTPAGRVSAHAFYALELGSTFQRVRHSPQPSISIDLRDIWDATLDDTVHSLGAGVAAELEPGRTTLRLDASFQRADGFGGFRSAPGGDPDLALDIAAFDDVRWLSLSAELERRLASGWSLAGGVWWDAQAVDDLIDEGRPDYLPGALVLAPRSFDYGVLVVTARVSRRF
jgi:hypothetical protein